jgi:hypothetical protein
MSMINSAIYKVIFAIIILLGVSTTAPGQPREARVADEMYGGIEISHDGVAAAVLRVSKNGEEPEIKLAHSEVIRLPLWRKINGAYDPQTSINAAIAVSKALDRLQQQYRVPAKHLYLIGSNRLGADHPEDLVTTIKNATGLTLSFLDEMTEIQLRVSGTVPKVGKEGDVTIDSRHTSALLHIGNVSSQAGYEIMKYLANSGPGSDYVGVEIPYGVISYTNEIIRATGTGDQYAFAREIKASSASNFRQALRKELERHPGMLYRKRFFLTGNLAWAMATLMYPEDRQPYVQVTYSGIAQFADRLARSPKEVVFQNLSFIRDRRVRQQVEQEIEEIKATFTPQQLIAGAEMLKAAAEELKWKEKTIVFAKFGNVSGIVTYVRLQTPQ